MSSISTAQITIAQLYEQQREPLSLEVLTKGLEARVPITISDINRPGMALMGYPENFLFERIQILGRTEIAYLGTLSPKGRAEALDRLFQFAMPAIIVTKGLQLPDGLQIVRSKPKPRTLSVDQAVRMLLKSREPVLVFSEREDGGMRVAYRLEDGQVGLLELD